MNRTTQSGLLSTEMALMLPVVVVAAFVAVYFGQIAQITARAQAAADSAARAASIVGTEGDAATHAATEAAADSCPGPVRALDTRWTVPTPTRPGRVVVSLVCSYRINGLPTLIGERSRDSAAVGVAAIEFWRPDR